ncbi:hypothetical protein ILP97_00365 [Amycolatopsis sp. H6(2020)]|nr:hypothetical protein [Amycolatopsis sp. H6(2020)]
MGFDWESILGTSGTGLDDAYDAAVSAVMYPDEPTVEVRRSFPVEEAHDEDGRLDLVKGPVSSQMAGSRPLPGTR